MIKKGGILYDHSFFSTFAMLTLFLKLLMSETIKIKKGLDVKLNGEAPDNHIEIKADIIGIVPDDFPGWKWRLEVKEGDKVLKGSPLLSDKSQKGICIVSPASGMVEQVVRGERRKIEAVIIKVGSDSSAQSDFNKDDSDRQTIVKTLCESGLWALMRQRPYDYVPDPEITPRDIFITAFDTSPLAGKMIFPSMIDNLQAGIKILSKLTDGKVYLGVSPDNHINSDIARVYEIEGPHPAGNVGVQIANIKPVNKKEVVWALDARLVVRIGELFSTGQLDMKAEVAVTGPEVMDPFIADTVIGIKLSSLLKGHVKDVKSDRIISGNVLTGWKSNIENDFLRWPYRQVTIIKEGDDADEFMGWASLNPNKYSVKRSFPAFLKGLKKPFDFDARVKGGKRGMILSGEYDKVFPFDIYPEFLIKAIQAKDIDKMEQLGIYEVAPEDFALPEFVDTSKIELQKIVRDGLKYLHDEVE